MATVAKLALEISEDTPEIYANFVQVLTSEWDFLMVFGSTRVSTNEKHEITPNARAEILVRMSPQHARATANLLMRMVESYEEEVAKKEGADASSEEHPEPVQDGTRRRRSRAVQ